MLRVRQDVTLLESVPVAWNPAGSFAFACNEDILIRDGGSLVKTTAISAEESSAQGGQSFPFVIVVSILNALYSKGFTFDADFSTIRYGRRHI